MTNRMKMATYTLGAVLVFALVFALAFALVPNNAPTAHADDPVPYVSRSWDGSKVVDTEESCTTYTVVASDTTSWTDGNWYVVKEDVTIGSRITVSGTVNLILADGATLNANKGITLTPDNTLNIYGQIAGTGALNATAKNYLAGIGGTDYNSAGTLTVHGGVITATGGNDAAGIGGGDDGGNGGMVTVYGGSVTANGGEYGAGIGGGDNGGNGGMVIVYCGTVTATGGNDGAGIGGGWRGAGGTVIVNGGMVAATAGESAVAIGRGSGSGSNGTLTVNNEDLMTFSVGNTTGITTKAPVTLNTNGGTINSGDISDYPQGVQYNLPTDVTREEYVFVGWYDNESLTGEALTAVPATARGEVEYWAKWIRPITYNPNGGTINSGNVTSYEEGVGATLPSNVTRDRYVFVGWYDNEDFEGDVVTEIGADATGVKEYWAKWNPTISYNNLGGGTINGDYANYYVEGVGTTLPTDVTRENATFLGWYGNADFTGEAVTEIGTEDSGVKTYWAKWTNGIVLHPNGGTINVDYDTSYEEGAGIVSLPIEVTYESRVFLGWYDNCGLGGEAVTEIGTDARGFKEYWAKWNIVSYMAWDSTSQEVSEVSCDLRDYNGISSDTTSWTNGKWYVASDVVTIGSRVTVSGTVNLILTDGAKLTVNGGIRVSSGNTINIYAQAAGTGTLVATNAGNYNAGIGGGDDGGNGGTFNIHGGVITANGGVGAAGIGGGYNGTLGVVTIYGGKITANGNTYCAGIGGGYESWGNKVTIMGGAVFATGGYTGEGIAGTLEVADHLSVYCDSTKVEKVDGKYPKVQKMIVAKFSPVTLNTNGGSIKSGNITEYAEGVITTLPTDVTRANYVFVGWYGNEELTGDAYTYIPGTAEGAIAYWAKWNSAITYNTNGGVINGDKAVSYEEGVGATLPTDVTRANYFFMGWYDNEELTGDAVTTIGSDAAGSKTYWAKWKFDIVSAYDACEEGGTIVLPEDIDLSGEADDFLVVKKNVTFDLNGHILNITSDFLHSNYKLKVKGGAFITLDDTSGAVGGVKGICGVNTAEGSYILLKNCRLTFTVQNILDSTDINHIADNFIVKDIDNAPDSDGFSCLVRPMVDQEYADIVDALIDDIGDVSYDVACYHKIFEVARPAYEALTDAQKELVAKYDVLVAAEAKYNELKEIADVIAAIAAIGEVEYTAESKAKIDAAQEAFDALSDEQKDRLNNTYKLVYAIQKYQILEATALIDAIGTVEYTAECKEKIDAARAAYDELGEKLQPTIENTETLTEAEAAYKILEDAAKANAAKALIEAIGTVEYTAESKGKIDAAQEAYEALTDEQKALIDEDVPTMTTAVATYETLRTNYLAAQEVIELINSIGTVEYTAESKGKIDAATEAYNNLSDDQKALVENKTDIPTAEATYEDLANKAAAQIVITKIAAIGEVTYPNSKDAIEQARTAYDELTDPQKELVENYAVLTVAEETYTELLTEANKGLSGGAIAGIVIGCFFGLILIAFIVLFVLYKRDKDKEDDKKIIKVAAINNVMAKVDPFLTKAWNAIKSFAIKAWTAIKAFCVMIGEKVKALWNKLFKKKDAPAEAQSVEEASADAEQSATEDKPDDTDGE